MQFIFNHFMSNSRENFIEELPNSAVNECLFYKIFNVCILNISLCVLNISQYLNTLTVKNIPGIKKKSFLARN